MKKTKLLLALCLAGSMANAQIIYTVAGNGTAGYSGNSGFAVSAELNHPQGVALDASGNLFIADNYNNVIRKVTSTGIITTVVGNHTAGFSGDGGAAGSAKLSAPVDIAFDGSGNMYISDQGNQRIRKVTAISGNISTSCTITTVAGNGTAGYVGDGSPATSYELNYPQGIVVDASGNLYIADQTNNMIRKLSGTTISLIAGKLNGGFGGFSGDGGQATAALLYNPVGVEVDASGNIYIADEINHRIRKIIVSTGIINTIAGNGTAGFSGNGGQATAAKLDDPYGVVVDASGNLYIADEANFEVRKVTTAGVISAYAGNNSEGYTGDGGAATAAKIDVAYGLGIAIDGSGNIFIPDNENSVVRKVSVLCPADAGPNTGHAPDCACPDVTIGTPAVPSMSYTWSPSTDLSSTNTATTSSSYCVGNGSITYTVTVSGTGCTTNTSTVLVKTASLGPNCRDRLASSTGIATQNQASTNFVVYPNPANSQVTISLYDKADYIRLIDMQGRLVFEAKNITDENYILDVSKYNKGIYFINAKIGDVIEKKKLVVE